jgi:hypothetical protein
MKTFEYQLDEFMPLPGQALYVYGNATIQYEWEPGDRSVGVPSGVALIDVTEIEIDSHRSDGEYMRLPPGPLFDLIAKALLNSYDVACAAGKHLDSEQWSLF